MFNSWMNLWFESAENSASNLKLKIMFGSDSTAIDLTKPGETATIDLSTDSSKTFTLQKFWPRYFWDANAVDTAEQEAYKRIKRMEEEAKKIEEIANNVEFSSNKRECLILLAHSLHFCPKNCDSLFSFKKYLGKKLLTFHRILRSRYGECPRP